MEDLERTRTCAPRRNTPASTNAAYSIAPVRQTDACEQAELHQQAARDYTCLGRPNQCYHSFHTSTSMSTSLQIHRDRKASRVRPSSDMTPTNMLRFTMNRLLNRKKTDDSLLSNGDARQLSSPTPPMASPGLKKSATSRWKNKTRNVKEEPEPKPEINLTDVLPSNDDFRTSLLMANLSQRFSMLREQDNPGSLMGKASDDSVLEPRRRSRKLDFGFGAGVSGLTDIDEVRSINSSIRPPFAGGKHESFMSGDGYASETESPHMMARSRPGEGNTMFGGRQKVYMIHKNGGASTKSLGKFLYDDDVGMSAFQKHRQREKELQAARDPEMPEDPSFDFGLGQAEGGDEEEQAGLHDSVRDFSNSPSLSAYDKKRSTCSTSRSEARSSTAATSITSQPATSSVAQLPAPTAVPIGPLPAAPLERSNTNQKSRRLYDQGLDQHMQDQQTSAISRLNSLQKQRPYNNGKASPPFLHSAKSTGSLTERAPLRVYTSQSSPPVPPLATFGSFAKPGQSPLGSVPNSPMSPTMDDSGVLNQALDAADRGKATAMGAFNKPKHAFDEQQYMERQMQLQRSASSALPRQPSASAFQQRMGSFEQSERERNTSNPASRSRSQSASRPHESLPAANASRNVPTPQETVQGAQQTSEKGPYPDTHRTFFGNISASDSEDEGDEVPRAASPYGQDHGYGQPYGRWQPTVLPSVSEHPALRPNGPPALVEEETEDELTPMPPTHSGQPVNQELVVPPRVQGPDLDSPTLGPTPEGLGSMMHHLRNRSNASSTYPQDETSYTGNPMPDLPTMPDLKDYESARQSVLESQIDSSNTTNSNPWDLDETNSNFYNDGMSTARNSSSPIDGRNSRSGRVSSRAPSSTALPAEQQTESWPDTDENSWQTELTKQHTRNISTATQQERAAFDNELAARRRAIQENVKSMVDADQSRNTSPAPTTGGARKAFNMLRSKSSRDSMDTRKEAPPKALKMLGLGVAPISASTSNLHSQYERGGKSLEMGRARGDSTSRGPTFGRVLQQSDVDAKRERATSRVRGDSEASRTGRPVGRSPASSEAGRGRGRSNSEATHGGRSRSTTGPYRDDLDRAMAQGTGTSAFGVPELSPMITRELTPRPSPNISNKSSFETKNRSRSGSRTGAMTNYFEAKSLQASQGVHHGRVVGPSPAVMANSFMANGGASRGSPYMQVPTPPISGPNTPVASSPTPPPMPAGPPLRSVPLRKKTINKHEISEPVALLSSTSQVGTVDLPAGASLKNGMDSPPPLPPVNPRRRATRKLFGMGRSEPEETSTPETDLSRSRTPDPWGTAASVTRSRNVSNPPRPFDSTPALQQYGMEQSGPPTRQFSNAKSPPMRPHNPEHSGVTSPEPMDRPPMEGGFI